MTLLLVPGFWLGAESWGEVTRHLGEAGADWTALTLPGLERGISDVGTVRLVDQISAVVTAVESTNGDVVLVGHSAAGPICHAAAARVAGKIRRVVHVDTWPLGPGLSINADIADGVDVIGFPDWDIFEPEDLVDMTGPLRERLRSESRPQPAAIARDPLPEMTADRLAIPTTIICCEFTAAQLSKWMLSEPERFSELRQLSDVSYIELPTGHWPQFTKPRELAAALLSVA